MKIAYKIFANLNNTPATVEIIDSNVGFTENNQHYLYYQLHELPQDKFNNSTGFLLANQYWTGEEVNTPFLETIEVEYSTSGESLFLLDMDQIHAYNLNNFNFSDMDPLYYPS